MRISFICNYIYINDGWSPWDKRVGGSEEFIIEVSKRLAKKHDVQVFHNGQHGNYEGVEYRSHDDFTPGDITINVNFPEFKTDGKQIFWTSLTEHPDLSHFEAVCYISEYAKANTGIEHKNTFWVPPGYDEKKIYPDKKMPKQCLYASSPDRGLDFLLEIWPKVYEAHPDATLVITYGAEANLPGIINLGAVDDATMSELYRTSQIWAYPCTGNELYCMTGIKAQAASCYPLIIPHMALEETVKFGRTTDKEHYADALINLLNQKEFPKYDYKYPTWDDSTKMLLDVVNLMLEKGKTNG